MRLPLWILLTCVVYPGALHAGSLDITGDIWARYESNISNSDASRDRIATGVVGGRIGVQTAGVWSRDWRWHLGLSAEGESVVRFSDLSRMDVGIRAGVERKFGLGWRAPRLLVDMRSIGRISGEWDSSGIGLSPSLALTWQGGERWGISVQYSPQWFFARGVLFDSTAQTAGFSTWFDLFPTTRLQVRYQFRTGDIVSYATPPRPDLVAISEVQENTLVFGSPRVRYRFDADTHAIEVGVVQRLDDRYSLNAAYRLEITQGKGKEYENHVFEFGARVEL
ncbi:MAG TPA: hypothetical protein VIT91_10490 [Chthoniobacterales bacterium]